MLLFAISCKKDNNKTAANSNISVDVAADLTVSSVASNSLGFASVADNISANAQAVSSAGNGQAVNSTAPNAVIRQTCGSTISDSLSFSGTTNAVSIDAFYKYSQTLNCNNDSPDNLANVITFHGTFDGPRLSSSVSGTSAVTISGLASSANNFTINGLYSRKGSFTSKVDAKSSGSSVVAITVTNVTLSKPGRVITGGSANITVSGTVPAGAFSFNSTLVFNGNNQATLTIGASVYIINLLNGTYTKQ